MWSAREMPVSPEASSRGPQSRLHCVSASTVADLPRQLVEARGVEGEDQRAGWRQWRATSSTTLVPAGIQASCLGTLREVSEAGMGEADYRIRELSSTDFDRPKLINVASESGRSPFYLYRQCLAPQKAQQELLNPGGRPHDTPPASTDRVCSTREALCGNIRYLSSKWDDDELDL